MITLKKQIRQRVKHPEGRLGPDSLDPIVSEYDLQQAESLEECLQLAGSEAVLIRLFNRAWAVEMNKQHKPKEMTLSSIEKLLKKVSPEVRTQLEKLPHSKIVEVIRRAQAESQKPIPSTEW